MNIADFTQQQREALLGLLVLGMYADGHLACTEDAHIQRVLTAMGIATGAGRNRELDAAITRVRQYSESSEIARSHAAQWTRSFAKPEHRRQVLDLLDEVIRSDGQVASRESELLAAVKEGLRL